MLGLIVFLNVLCYVCCDDSLNLVNGNVQPELPRQKRLLFYDEQGNLVKTYTNPYLRDYGQNQDNLPFFGGFFNPFINFFRPSSFNTPMASPYMIPISDEIIQEINKDPMYQNKLFFIPKKDPAVEFNPLCFEKRTQIPSPGACSSFLNCWDGWAFEQDCPPGLMFSTLGFCDYPDNVNCDSRRIKDDPPAEQKQCGKEFEAFRNELQCSEFFVCVNRQPVRFKCPADLAFNQELGICDYPHRVNCNGSYGISTEAPAATSKQPDSPPAISSDDPKEAVLSSPPNLKMLTMKNAVYNHESWSSSYMAMSRQDAIRQLELQRIAKVKTDY